MAGTLCRSQRSQPRKIRRGRQSRSTTSPSLTVPRVRRHTLSGIEPRNRAKSHLASKDCREFHDLISATLDGEIDSAEERALNDHLTSCVACAAYRRVLSPTTEST